MNRIIAHMVVKDEANRYLGRCLDWLTEFVDQIHVYDDRSTDDTVSIASSVAAVGIRGADCPSFLEHEGRFRQVAWNDMERRLKPNVGDIILAVDADEFPVCEVGERAILEWLMGEHDWQTLSVGIPEVYDGMGSDLYVRVDGYWPTITGTRIAKYKPGGLFKDAAMASGSLPQWEWGGLASDLFFLHFGYADPKDRKAKYDRYSKLPGHSKRHVESIMQPPIVEKWTGKLPRV